MAHTHAQTLPPTLGTLPLLSVFALLANTREIQAIRGPDLHYPDSVVALPAHLVEIVDPARVAVLAYVPGDADDAPGAGSLLLTLTGKVYRKTTSGKWDVVDASALTDAPAAAELTPVLARLREPVTR